MAPSQNAKLAQSQNAINKKGSFNFISDSLGIGSPKKYPDSPDEVSTLVGLQAPQDFNARLR